MFVKFLRPGKKHGSGHPIPEPRLVLSASSVRVAIGTCPLTQTLLLGDLCSISSRVSL